MGMLYHFWGKFNNNRLEEVSARENLLLISLAKSQQIIYKESDEA